MEINYWLLNIVEQLNIIVDSSQFISLAYSRRSYFLLHSLDGRELFHLPIHYTMSCDLTIEVKFGQDIIVAIIAKLISFPRLFPISLDCLLGF